MAIELCIESAAVVAEAVSSGFQQALMTTTRTRLSEFSWLRQTSSPELGEEVRQLASSLPLGEARAVWLVDTCGYSYQQGADVTGLTPDQFGELVAAARRGIRRMM